MYVGNQCWQPQSQLSYPVGRAGLGSIPPPTALGCIALTSSTTEGTAVRERPFGEGTAPTTSNLLPLSGSGPMTSTAGVYVEEGLPQCQKLASKI